MAPKIVLDFMKVSICPDCADIHAKNIVDMYKDLKTPLKKMRSETNFDDAKAVLDRLMHDSVTMGFYRGHGPLNIEMASSTMHILDQKNRRLCENKEALNKVNMWKQESE